MPNYSSENLYLESTMVINLFYLLNLSLLLTSLLALRRRQRQQQFSISLIITLAALPLLAAEYIWFSCHFYPSMVRLIFFSEGMVALSWSYMASRLRRATVETTREPVYFSLLWVICGGALLAVAVFIRAASPAMPGTDDSLVFPLYGVIYLGSVVLLLSMLFMAWCLESFWRSLPPVGRWQYKYLVIESYLVCGSLGWAASYRLIFLRLVPQHVQLLALLLVLAWVLMGYATLRHRLLKRKIFVSRQVVHPFVAPIVFAGYLLLLGAAVVLMRTFGWTLSFVMTWDGALIRDMRSSYLWAMMTVLGPDEPLFVRGRTCNPES
jgi:hypothetical protein